MDNEIKEKLNELLEKVIDKVSKNMDGLEDNFNQAVKEPCKIHVDNDGKGTGVKVEGKRLSLLITLAGAEKNILKELNCSNSEFDFIKNMVASEIADKEEANNE